MHLSTSSSNERLPDKPWARIWILAIILSLLSLGGLEVTVRAKGYQPSVRADSSLWALIRNEMPENDLNVVALVGSSRMLCAFNLDVFGEEYGVKPVQLALIHSSPIPVLEDFAADEGFRGLIICELTPELFFSDDADDIAFATGALSTREAMDDALFDYWETRVSTYIQSNVVSQSGQLQLEDILPAMIDGNWPEATHRFRADRQRFFDSSRTDHRLQDIQIPDGPEEDIELSDWQMGIIGKVKGYISGIRDRGGDVVFVYLPCRGPNKIEEILIYPREIYWDGVLEATGAYGVHIEDYTEISHLRPEVDYSHLDIDQAKLYSRHLARILKTEYKRAVRAEEEA